MNIQFVMKLEDEIKVLGVRMNLGTPPRKRFAYASALYYVACVDMSNDHLERAEVRVRESLGILDDFIVDEVFSENCGKTVYTESWISVQEITMGTIWARRASLENMVSDGNIVFLGCIGINIVYNVIIVGINI